MRIRRMRIALPSRLRKTAQVDARIIAEAAALAIDEAGVRDTSTIEIRGAGRPAAGLASEITGRANAATRSRLRGGR